MLPEQLQALRYAGRRVLERDEAEREPPCETYPWDGVRNVRPFSRFQASVTEGVY